MKTGVLHHEKSSTDEKTISLSWCFIKIQFFYHGWFRKPRQCSSMSTLEGTDVKGNFVHGNSWTLNYVLGWLPARMRHITNSFTTFTFAPSRSILRCLVKTKNNRKANRKQSNYYLKVGNNSFSPGSLPCLTRCDPVWFHVKFQGHSCRPNFSPSPPPCSRF